MYGQKYIMSKPFFKGWIVVSIIWLFIAFLYITFYPVYESWSSICEFYRKVTGKEEKTEVEFLYGNELEHASSEEVMKNSVIEAVSEKGGSPALSSKV